MIKIKIEVKIVKQIEIPDNIVINNIEDLSDDTLNRLLMEIKTQIQPYFTQDIYVRRRYGTSGVQECRYCNREFDNVRGLKMHITQSHRLQKKGGTLFLSAHRVESALYKFIYFMLENKADDSSQTIFKLKFPK